MQKAEWANIKEIFHQTLDLPPSEREQFLALQSDTVRREVAELIASHESAEEFIASTAVDEYGLDRDALKGKQVGNYTLIDVVGTGGMGTVYRATREGFDKEFAVKLIKRGMDTDAVLRRFQLERRILSRLEHPNITGLIDGGTTDSGLPYFVLEFVDGIPVNRYCGDNRLDTRARLELFQQICSAVAYAHQNLVVHRDLKPSNILVTADGTPKLLDFGIAKLLGSDEADATSTQARMFTPEYASPEQLNGQPVTTASDVYSLGVVLYELISGQRPFRAAGNGYHDIVNRILTEEPARPSTFIGAGRRVEINETSAGLDRSTGGKTKGSVTEYGVADRRSIEGDLDNIILKALRKEPERRYQSVQELSDDIRRHLGGLPVTATADSTLYRLSKFVRRHRMGVVAGTFAAIVIFTVSGIAIRQGIVAERERARAERRFAQVRKLANAVLFDYQDGIERLPGSTPMREKMVRDAIEYLDNLAAESTGDMILQRELAAAYAKVGEIQGNPYYSNLGDMNGALASYNKALAIRSALSEATPADRKIKLELANSFASVADMHWAKGDYPDALEKYRQALAVSLSLSAEDPSDLAGRYAVAHRYYYIGQTQRKMGDREAALESFNSALEIDRSLLSADPGNEDYQIATATAYLKLGDVHYDSGEFRAALEHHQRAVEIYEPLAADQANAVSQRMYALFLNRLGADKRNLGDMSSAIEIDKKAIAIEQRLLDLDPTNEQFRLDLANHYQSLGETYIAAGKINDGIELIGRSVKVYEESLAKNPDDAETAEWLASARRTLADAHGKKP